MTVAISHPMRVTADNVGHAVDATPWRTVSTR